MPKQWPSGDIYWMTSLKTKINIQVVLKDKIDNFGLYLFRICVYSRIYRYKPLSGNDIVNILKINL